MKLRINKKPKAAPFRVRDRRHSESLSKSLIRASEKKQRQSLVKRGEKPKPRPIQVTVEAPSDNKPRTTVKLSLPLNSSGNRRGMENSENTARMQKVRAMRRIYNKQMPVPECNNCAFSQACPKFKAGFQCAFLPFLTSHEVQTPEDLMHYMQDQIAAGMRRFQMSSALETLSGGAPSLELSESLMMLFNMTRDLYDIQTKDNSGMVDIETDDNSIISRLFGSTNDLLGETMDAIHNPIDSSQAALDEVRDGHVGDGFETFKHVNREVLDEVTKSELASITKRDKKARSLEVGGDVVSAKLKKI